VIEKFGDALYSKNGVKPDDIGVKAIDDKTLEIKLVQPCGYFIELISSAYPVRQDVYEKYGQSYGSTVDKIVTNGAFKLVKWEPNVQLTYEKNKTYWNAKNVKLQRIEAKVISDTATAAQAHDQRGYRRIFHQRQGVERRSGQDRRSG
jgi:ABC-type oligopeptide transport system substrate-binding subunit